MPHRWADDWGSAHQFWISQCPTYLARRAGCPARSRWASPHQTWADAPRWSCWCATMAVSRRWSVTWADRAAIDCDMAGWSARSRVLCFLRRAARVNRTLVACLQWYRKARRLVESTIKFYLVLTSTTCLCTVQVFSNIFTFALTTPFSLKQKLPLSPCLIF